MPSTALQPTVIRSSKLFRRHYLSGSPLGSYEPVSSTRDIDGNQKHIMIDMIKALLPKLYRFDGSRFAHVQPMGTDLTYIGEPVKEGADLVFRAFAHQLTRLDNGKFKMVVRVLVIDHFEDGTTMRVHFIADLSYLATEAR